MQPISSALEALDSLYQFTYHCRQSKCDVGRVRGETRQTPKPAGQTPKHGSKWLSRDTGVEWQHLRAVTLPRLRARPLQPIIFDG